MVFRNNGLAGCFDISYAWVQTKTHCINNSLDYKINYLNRNYGKLGQRTLHLTAYTELKSSTVCLCKLVEKPPVLPSISVLA